MPRFPPDAPIARVKRALGVLGFSVVRVDVDKIAKGLGAERRGKVSVSGGQFGAMQLVAEVQARFRVPTGGGRATASRKDLDERKRRRR